MQSARATRVALLTAAAALVNGGEVRVFADDTADPDAPSNGLQLAKVSFASTAFQPLTDDGTNASVVANPLVRDPQADATGRATHWRAYQADGTTVTKGTVSDLSGTGELKLKDVNLIKDVPFDILSLIWRAGQG